MIRFGIGRLFSGLVTAWVVVSATFFMVRLVPGDPATSMAPPTATPAQIDQIRSYLGLGEPLWVQYGAFLNHLAHLDLGTSIRTNQPVLSDLLDRFPATIELAVASILLEILIAIPIGAIAAVKHNRPFDHISRFASLIGVGIPVFWMAIMALWLLAYKFPILPLGGRLDIGVDLQRHTGFTVVDALIDGRPDLAVSGLKHLILPAVILAIPSMAFWTRLMRGSMLEVLGSDHVRTARAKGLSEPQVVRRHAVRNALNPVITSLGLDLVALLSGVIFIENVFAWPGVGNYIFGSIQTRDYPVVQGSVILIALLYVTVNTIVDVVQAVLDPRIRPGLQGQPA
ncbi:MAG: ABC transporter permease [Nocardioidaceae bacterium]